MSLNAALATQRIAGIEVEAIVDIIRSVAKSVQHLHMHAGRIHGDSNMR